MQLAKIKRITFLLLSKISIFQHKDIHYNKIIMKLKVVLPKKPSFQCYKEIDNRWSQIKMSNPFTARQAFAFTSQGQIGYLHGGYNCDQGILKDMYLAKFNDPDERHWRQIEQKGKLPGKLRYHTLTSYLCYLLCIGGQRSQVQNNEEVYCFNLKSETWSKLNVRAEDSQLSAEEIKNILGRDSHCCCVNGKYLYIFGGYCLKQGEYLNDVVRVNLEKINESEIFVKVLKFDSQIPKARSNFASCVLADNMYIFGGTNSLEFFDDLWRFNFTREEWLKIVPVEGKPRFYWPEKRKGAVLVPYFESQSLMLFGGMQTITKQQNDLSIYLISKNQWVKIHSNTNNLYDVSPTLKTQPETSPTIIFHKSKKQIKEKQQFKLGITSVKPSVEEEPVMHATKSSFHRGTKSVVKSDFNSKVCKTQMSFSRPHQSHEKEIQSATHTNKNFFTNFSQHKMTVVQEKRYRQFLARKKRLLSEIYAGYRVEKQKRPFSPTSQCLNYTIHQLGEQNEFLQSKNPQFQLPKVIFDDKKSQVIGKKPCARDGHAAFCNEKKMFIIGGDRHMVSFNDTHLLHMDKAMESVSFYT